METSIEEFYAGLYIQYMKIWNLICHIYASWVTITVANNAVRHFRRGVIIEM